MGVIGAHMTCCSPIQLDLIERVLKKLVILSLFSEPCAIWGKDDPEGPERCDVISAERAKKPAGLPRPREKNRKVSLASSSDQQDTHNCCLKISLAHCSLPSLSTTSLSAA